jgi:hypothetical protein
MVRIYADTRIIRNKRHNVGFMHYEVGAEDTALRGAQRVEFEKQKLRVEAATSAPSGAQQEKRSCRSIR